MEYTSFLENILKIYTIKINLRYIATIVQSEP